MTSNAVMRSESGDLEAENPGGTGITYVDPFQGPRLICGLMWGGCAGRPKTIKVISVKRQTGLLVFLSVFGVVPPVAWSDCALLLNNPR